MLPVWLAAVLLLLKQYEYETICRDEPLDSAPWHTLQTQTRGTCLPWTRGYNDATHKILEDHKLYVKGIQNTELFFQSLLEGMHHVLTEHGRSVKMVKLSILHNYAAVPDGGWKRSPLTAF